MRIAPTRWVVPYVGAGTSTYPALRTILEEEGPAEVVIVGSSRARDSIAAPDLAAACSEALGRRVSVGNYASPAATADEVEFILRFVFAQERKPAVILYGISPSQLSPLTAAVHRAGRMWRLADWERESSTLHAAHVGRAREIAVQNELGWWCRLYGYRDSVGQYLRQLLGAEPRHSNPILGQLSDQHASDPDARLGDAPRDDAEVRALLRPEMRDGRYPLGGEAARHFESVLTACRDAGVTLVVYEVPLTDSLVRSFPRGTLERMRRIALRLANEHRAHYVQVEDLGVRFDETLFRDLSHMNLEGARRLTDRLARRVVVPALRGELAWQPRELPALPEGVDASADGEDYEAPSDEVRELGADDEDL